MSSEKLNLYKVRMFGMFRNEKVIYYVMYSEKDCYERWKKEYQQSSWFLDSITKIDEVDGHKISFLEEKLEPKQDST